MIKVYGADRRRRRRQHRRISCRDLLSVLRPLPAGAGFSCSAKRNAAELLCCGVNDHEIGKNLKCATISIISCRIVPLFALPCSRQEAYPAAPDMPVCGGPGVRIFDPAETTTDG